MSSNNTKIDWNGPIQAAIVAAIILGANIPFFMISRSDMQAANARSDAQIAAIKQDVAAIQAEIKDFHGRLIAIEERKNK